MRKEHLHFLSIFARLLVKTDFRDGTSNIAGWLMNAATDLANRCVRAAAGFHRATRAIGLPGRINNRIGFGNVGARVFEWAPFTA